MGQITDTGRYIPLIEYFENCNTLLRASLRALVAMRLLDLYQSELPGKRRLLIDPDTFELMIGLHRLSKCPRLRHGILRDILRPSMCR